MNIPKKINGNTAIMYPTGRLDVTIANTFEKEIKTVIDDSKKYDIIVNMQEVNYLSSSGLRVITSTARALKEDNRKFCCCDASESVLAVFTVTNMLDVIKVYNSETEALQNISQ